MDTRSISEAAITRWRAGASLDDARKLLAATYIEGGLTARVIPIASEPFAVRVDLCDGRVQPLRYGIEGVGAAKYPTMVTRKTLDRLVNTAIAEWREGLTASELRANYGITVDLDHHFSVRLVPCALVEGEPLRVTAHIMRDGARVGEQTVVVTDA